MSVNKLLLEEAIEDSPQTHNFLTVFEEDAGLVRQYTEEFHGYCQQIQKAQADLASATHGLAQLMKKYSAIRFPLEKEDSYMTTTFPLLAEYMDEISTMQQILASQISDTLIYPINRFLSADLEELSQLQNLYKMVSDEHELAVQKHMKLAKRCSEKQRVEAVEEVFQMRKKQHKTALHYFSAMNLMQHKRQFVFLEAIAGHLQAHLSFFKIGSDYIEKQELETVHSNTKGLLLCGQRELDLERTRTSDLVGSIEESCSDAVYQPEPLAPPASPSSHSQHARASNPHLAHKSGYLMLRSRAGLLQTRWDREFFFTQTGNLMRQGRRDVAGCLLIDLAEPGIYAEPCDADDRRHVFQIGGPAGRKPIVLQAENEIDRDEWITAITNIVVSGGGYTKDTCASPISTAQQSQSQASPSVQSQHSQELPNKEKSASSAASKDVAQAGGFDDSWFDRVPIQFDLPHLTEAEEKSAALFDQQLTVVDSKFSVNYSVRFTGSMEVPGDRGDALVARTIRQILTARAVHNIFKSTDYNLIVSDRGIWLIEPQSKLIRCEFLLEDISFWASHAENTRLLGLICRSRAVDDGNLFACFTFECDSAAEQVCASIRQATRIAYQAFVSRKSEADKKKSKEMDEAALLLSNINRLPDMTPTSEEAPSAQSAATQPPVTESESDEQQQPAA
ncbi:hypothetical protein BOX15_Mlig013367g2 [Macrostomum lignano]|uniref:PH domain-containing protein n=1 Tax=Macrostomum lignano TaxID=282301 RepID=A0A267F488_9PLAT|nr:hypothetical protein BOX15_Mlig013367g2 [Macrostomum lignano]